MKSYTFRGIGASDFSGVSVSSAGDVDGDGRDDFIIGARSADVNSASGAGQIYLISGADLAALDIANGNPADGVIELSDVAATGASYQFNGIHAFDEAGHSVSSAGDVDGDGKDDFIIGAPKADPNGSISGEIYLISGADLAALDAASAGTPGVIELSDLAATGNSYQFIGADRGDWAGYSISSAGDVDKDGKDDFIIGAPRADPNGTTSGSVYLISGADLVALDLASGADGVIELSDVAAGSKSYQFNGVSAGDEAGSSVSSLRDVDGDGHDDLIIGAIDADPNGNSSGEIYFISGIDLAALDRASGVDGVIDLSDVAGTGGSYQFNGIALGDNAGSSVSSAGDVDGDGKDDLIIGAAMGQSNGVDSGEIYLISGKDFADLDFASGMDGVIELSDVAAVRGSYQFVGASANDQAGFAISSAGDVDNDGKDDLIIAAVTADPNGSTNAGSAYFISGADLADLDAASGTNGVIELSDVAATMTGNSYQFSGFNAMDNAGYSVSSAGDVDGDGKGDFIIGAPRADPNGNASGETYFISGADLADLDARSGADGVIELIHAMCFARGTLIQTQLGEVPIEQLEMGHRVLTMDDGYQPIRWIGRTALSRADLEANPKLKPIRIRADALGPGLPKQDLLVSPQHRVLVRSAIAHRMFDAHEVLIPANKLLTLPGIDIEWEADGVDYFHILFDAHQLVWSNGAVTESLFTGPEALKAVSPEAREEIETLFPEIARPDFVPTAVRFIPEKGKHMKTLTQRLVKNNKIAQESHGLHM